MSFPPHHPTPSSPSWFFVLLAAAHIDIFKIPARALLHKEPCFPCQGHSCLGSNHTLLAPGRYMKGAGGTSPSPVGWRPKAALFPGSDVRRARMHWTCRALNTFDSHSQGRYLSMSPLAFACFHTGHLGCVVSLPQFFFWAQDVFQSSTFLAFISSVFSQASLLIWQAQGTKICLQLQFTSCILEVRVFKFDLWVSMFLSREGHQTHTLCPG